MSYENETGKLTIYWTEDNLTEKSAFIGITLLCLSGLIYGLIMIYRTNTRDNIRDEIFSDKHLYEQMNDDETETMKGAQIKNSNEFQQKILKISNNINEAVTQIYLTQSLYMIFFGILLICGISYWFLPTVKAALVGILAFCLGICVGALNAYLCLKFTQNANTKLVYRLSDENYDGIKYSFTVGTFISSISISITVLIFSIMLLICRNKWIDEGNLQDENKNEYISEMYQNMAHALVSFGLGVSFACLFYREASGQSAKGIIIGDELIGKCGYDPQDFDYNQSSQIYRNIYDKDPNRIMDRNLRMAGLVSNSITNVLIPMMDTLAVLSSLLCSTLVIFVKVEAFQTEQIYGLYGAIWYVIISVLVSIGITYFLGGNNSYLNDQILTKKTAKIAFFQILLADILMLVVLLFWPRYAFPRYFVVGDIDHQMWSSQRIWHGGVVWCLCLGLILQMILLIFGEYTTSNWYTPVRQIAKDMKKRQTLGLMTAYKIANYYHFFIFSLIGVFILLSYCIAGFIGIALTGLGIISIPVTLLSIQFLAGISQDSWNFAQIAQIHLSIIDRLYKMFWPSRNYGIFTQMINMTAVFFANFSIFGGCLILSNVQLLSIWQGFTLLGFLIGGGHCYLLRSGSVSTCRAVCDQIIEEKEEIQNQGEDRLNGQNKNSYLNDINIDKEDKFNQFISTKFDIGINKVLYQIIVMILLIIFIGTLLGHKAILGYILGLNLVGLNMMLQQILLGNSIKSAKEFNDNKKEEMSKQESENNKNSYFYALSIEQFPASSLISYLCFASLFVLVGIQQFSKMGQLKNAIEDVVTYFPQRSTQWIDDYQYGIEQAFNHQGPQYNTTYESPTKNEVDGEIQQIIAERIDGKNSQIDSNQDGENKQDGEQQANKTILDDNDQDNKNKSKQSQNDQNSKDDGEYD